MTISATSQGLKPGVCTSSNRPANPFDGMMIYETDTNLVRIWNGTAWKTLAYSDYTSGSVIQVVSTTKTDTFSTQSTSLVDITGMSATITPTSTSSSVLVMVNMKWANNNNYSSRVILLRGSTNIGGGTPSGNRPAAIAGATSTSIGADSGTTIYLDSPATTSATTYKLQVALDNGNGTFYLNSTNSDTDNVSRPRFASTITLMEIAG